MARSDKERVYTFGHHPYATTLEDGVFTFNNIRYGRLPVDDRGFVRIFDKPIPVSPEDCFNLPPEAPRETVNSFEPGPMCLQKESPVTGEMSAVCQNMTLWVPEQALGSQEPVPVLFFVHGGSFMFGSNQNPELNGASLAKALGVIVVIPNYRLGPLGFMDFTQIDPGAASNCAFHDLILALHWVHDHIADFAGDPDNVTLMGESAGGTIVSVFPFIEQAKGLFHKLVVLSGIPSSFLTPEVSQGLAQKYLRFLETDDIQTLYNPGSWKKLAESVDVFGREAKLGAAAFLPTTDGVFFTDNAVALMRQAAEAGEDPGIPIWCNMTLDELSVMAVMPKVLASWGLDDLMNAAYDKEKGSTEDMGVLYEKAYGEKDAPTHIYSDMVIRAVLIWYMEYASHFQQAYFTRLDWATPMQKITRLGAFHSSELYILFDNPDGGAYGRIFFSGVGARTGGKSVVEAMQQDLNHFMREGKIFGIEEGEDLPPFQLDDYRLKAYAEEVEMRPVMPQELAEAWKATHYYSLVTGQGRDQALKKIMDTEDKEGQEVPEVLRTAEAEKAQEE